MYRNQARCNGLSIDRAEAGLSDDWAKLRRDTLLKWRYENYGVK